jgi:2'-5' RNA ligase
LAIFLEADVRNRLAREIRRLQYDEDHVKWVEADNLHVTLKFLGQITESDAVNVSRAMQRLAQGFEPHTADVFGLGAFPSLQVPRTIWAGFGEGGDELAALGRAIEEQCSQLGFRREHRPFTPHITLGRRRADSPARILAERIQQSAETDFGSLSIAEFCVVASNLKRSGPTYVPLATIPLGSNSD